MDRRPRRLAWRAAPPAADLLGARAAVARALDRIELCTDDVMRIARVTAVGASVEADLAQRARDLREKQDERDAIARARIHHSDCAQRRSKVDRSRARSRRARPSSRAPGAATTPSCGPGGPPSGTRSRDRFRPQSRAGARPRRTWRPATAAAAAEVGASIAAARGLVPVAGGRGDGAARAGPARAPGGPRAQR